MKILVVDDEEDLRVLLRFELEAQGHEVDEAGSGGEALAAIAASRPDLVMLDLRMPGMDGWDVLRDLQARGITPDLPVIALSAHASQELIAETLELGCATYVTKPFSFDDIRNALVRVGLG